MKYKVLAALASVTVLSGCVTNSEPALPDGWEEITPERVDAIAAMVDDEDGVLTAGTNPPFAPFEFEDDAGNIIGVEMELWRWLASVMGVDFQRVEQDFALMLPSIQG